MFLSSKTLLTFAWIASAAVAFAQSSSQQPTPPPPPPDAASGAKSQDQTGQDAKSSDDQSQQGDIQGYSGPTIISRDKSLIGERGGKLLDYRFYATVQGVYDSGLTPLTTSGAPLNIGAYGVETSFGVIGTRRWQRDSLSIEYSGAYRDYANSPYFNGLDQFLRLRWARQLSRHLVLDFRENAGTSKLANGEYSYLPLTNLDQATIPTQDLFDTRTSFSDSRLSLIWQKTARLSFSFAGDGFLVRRTGQGLAGMNGYNASADVSYRVTRQQTLSLTYSYGDFEYQGTFGFAHMSTAMLGYSVGVGRRWDASIQAGAEYAEIRGLQQIEVNPVIAAIIGQSAVTVNFDRFTVIPSGQASIVRRFANSSLNLGASIGMSPGNGVYLTSRSTVVHANYSYTGVRRWTFGVNGSYSDLSAVGQTLGKLANYQGGVASTYRISSLFHAEFRYDYRRYTTQSAAYRKDSERVTIGLAFSPGEHPLPIW